MFLHSIHEVFNWTRLDQSGPDCWLTSSCRRRNSGRQNSSTSSLTHHVYLLNRSHWVDAFELEMTHRPMTKKMTLKTGSWYSYQTQVCTLHEGAKKPTIICSAIFSGQISVWIINWSRTSRPSPSHGDFCLRPGGRGSDLKSWLGAVAAFLHVSLLRLPFLSHHTSWKEARKWGSNDVALWEIKGSIMSLPSSHFISVVCFYSKGSAAKKWIKNLW